jgi:hypothetical protein
MVAQQDGSFDQSLLAVQRLLEKLEKQFLNAEGGGDDTVIWQLGEHMAHAYYLDALESIRPTWQMALNLLWVVLSMVFIMGGLSILRDKNLLSNFHQKWTI